MPPPDLCRRQIFATAFFLSTPVAFPAWSWLHLLKASYMLFRLLDQPPGRAMLKGHPKRVRGASPAVAPLPGRYWSDTAIETATIFHLRRRIAGSTAGLMGRPFSHVLQSLSGSQFRLLALEMVGSFASAERGS